MDAATPTAMLVNLSRSFPALQQLIFVCAYLSGLLLLGLGLLRLLRCAAKRAAGGSACLALLCGSLLLALPGTMEALTASLFLETDPRRILSAIDPGRHVPERVLLLAVIDFMALIGWIAGGRGLYLISQAGVGSQHGALARGLSHLLGGVCLVNLQAFAHAIGLQLGIDTRLSRIVGV